MDIRGSTATLWRIESLTPLNLRSLDTKTAEDVDFDGLFLDVSMKSSRNRLVWKQKDGSAMTFMAICSAAWLLLSACCAPIVHSR